MSTKADLEMKVPQPNGEAAKPPADDGVVAILDLPFPGCSEWSDAVVPSVRPAKAETKS